MSAVPAEVLEVRPYPGGGVEVALPNQEGDRLSLFMGSNAPRPPRHPGLGRVLGSAHRDGDPCWLEERAAGPLLSELQGLDVQRIATALLDLASALAALHGSGLAHGSVGAERVVVQASGRAQLIGAGATSGTVTDDLAALRTLMHDLWPQDSPPPPDPGEGESAAILSESLAGWLSYHHPTATARAWVPPGPTVPEMALVIALQPVPEASHLDEIGFDLGPEPEGDRSTGSGTAGGQTEHTRPASAHYGSSPRRQAVLGRLLAFASESGDPDRFAAATGRPSTVIKTLLADEPLDPLPLPDGVPPMGQAMAPPVIHEVERTATGESTVTRVTALTELVSRQALAFTVAGSVVVVTAVGALVWLLLTA